MIDIESGIKKHSTIDGFVGQSEPMRKVFELIQKVAKSNIGVMITGESGTGKEIAAKAIHNLSSRANSSFVAINCAAIPQDLLESELFGHARGAFTGATGDRKGLFMEADGGTILLDEIGDLPLSLQAKILRLLQTREVRPVGQNESRKVDVRVVAATHKDLKSLIRNGRFREDLYYRLNVIPIHMPPLRERGDDVKLLADHFLKINIESFNCGRKYFSEETLRLLMRAAWLGNVRELENVILRAIAVSCEEEIRPCDILIESERLNFANFNDQDQGFVTLDELEKQYIQFVLSRVPNKNEAAMVLGIDRKTLYNKEKEYGLSTRRRRVKSAKVVPISPSVNH